MIRERLPSEAFVVLGHGASSIPDKEMSMQAFLEACQRSRAEKTGLTFYVAGQSIAMVVRELHGTELVEGYNQTHGRILLRLESVIGVAEN